ncbi:MAG: LPXTG cell wall anchor domain-containing protein [Stomatobaculum sp.]|nr:LPXTG cell wall anchor domain-containing protein [Stomatobaculum sp.]
MTCLAAVVVFGVTYALILPAITMTSQHPTLSAETLTAWTGDELAVKVAAETTSKDGGKIVVLTLEGEGADLSQNYAFNEEGVCTIIDEAQNEIELHRSVREGSKNVVDYWFAMEPDTETSFVLNLVDEIDEARFAETMEAVKQSGGDTDADNKAENKTDTTTGSVVNVDTQVETATDSDAGKSEVVENNEYPATASASDAQEIPVIIVEEEHDSDEQEDEENIVAEASVSVVQEASASNAEQASVSIVQEDEDINTSTASNADVEEANKLTDKAEEKIVVESNDSGFVEILDGAVVNDLVVEDEDEEQTETVATLKVSAGIGEDYEDAVKDAEKNADKRGDAQLKLKWIDAVASVPELVANVNDATIAVFYDENAGIPAGASLVVDEIAKDSDEYAALFAQADSAVMGAAGEGAAKMVTSARFFDISIVDENGDKIQPDTSVKVVIAYEDGIKITELGELNVVHFNEGADVPEVFTSAVSENGQEAGGFSFTTDSFSVFGVVGAEMLAPGEIVAEGENCTIKVSYDSGARLLPSDTLVISEIPDGSGRYQTYMGEAGGVLLGEGKNAEISYARFFDISIRRDDVMVEPQTPVQISIDYTAAQDLGTGTTVRALNFKENGPDVLDVDLRGSETQLNGVSFGVGALKTFGIAGARGGKTKSLTAEGSTFKMTVAYGAEADIPEGAKLAAEEVAEGTEEAGQYKKLAADATQSKEEELTYIKTLNAAIVDAEGKKIQPAAPVDLKIELEDKKDEFETQVVFFGEDGTAEAAAPTAEGKKVSLETAKITSFAVVETKAPKITKITGKASDGATVEISGKLPEGAEAKIVPVTLTQEQLIEYYGEDLVKAVDNLVVYDICIMVDGKEWEPDDSVSVVINNPKIETQTDSNEEIAVTHLNDEKKSAEKMDTVVTEDGGVSFDTKSFSLWGLYTYTVDYYLNDNEYHQPGNTSMLLSELFVPLLVEIPVAEVADVQFTDYTLLSIEPEGEDFRITSLKPFTSHEVMTVIFKNDAQLTIVVEDLKYAEYEYETSDLTPYTGSFNYVGHYNIFGGGNGLPSIVKDSTNENDDWAHWWAGEWGGNSAWDSDTYTTAVSGIRVHLPMLKGKAVGNGPGGVPLEAVSGMFRTGSSAEITWSGNIEKAFMSFSWLYYHKNSGASKPTHAQFDIKLYAPGGDYTTIVINTDTETNDTRPDDPIVGNDTTDAWRMLSFDATDFVTEHGKGVYTMVVEVSPTPGHTTINSYLSDMGFTIFGVTADASQPISAVVGTVDEIMIAQNSSGLTNRAAVVMLEEPITPRGKGKAWFNCQGGEYISTSSGSEVDRDYLELMTPKEGTTDQYNYLKLGEGGQVPVAGWNCEDIACPNHNQTPPDEEGYEAYSNRCSFGLGAFSGLENSAEIVGVRKRMVRGNDCFGSLMMLIEVMPAEGTVEVTKKLEYDGGGVNDVLPDAGVQRTLTFHVEPTNNAPVPYRVEGEGEDAHEVPNQDFSINFPANTHSGDEVLFDMGKFRFRGQDIPDSASSSGPWYFTYEVTETSTDNMEPWIYDTRTLLLTFEVVVNESDGSFKINSHEWSVKDHPEDEVRYFKNDYILPVALKVDKKDFSGQALSGATFCLYTNEECTTVAPVYTNAAKTTALTSSGVVTGIDGAAYFYGLDKGTADDPAVYYLKEIAAPGAYVLDSTVIAVNYNKDEDKWYYTPTDSTATVLPGSVTGDQGYLTLQRVNLNALHVTKIDKTTSAAIPGVKFELSKKDVNGTYQAFVEEGHAAGDNSYTTDENGKFDLHLPVGEYLLQETETPQGYIINADCKIEFEVVDQGTSQVVFQNTDFAEYESSTFTFTAKNTRGQSLPNTGGPGTTLYTLGGMMLLIASALLYGFRRRHEERRSM